MAKFQLSRLFLTRVISIFGKCQKIMIFLSSSFFTLTGPNFSKIVISDDLKLVSSQEFSWLLTFCYGLWLNGRRIYPFNKGLRIYGGGVYHPPFDTLKVSIATYESWKFTVSEISLFRTREFSYGEISSFYKKL